MKQTSLMRIITYEKEVFLPLLIPFEGAYNFNKALKKTTYIFDVLKEKQSTFYDLRHAEHG